MSHRKLVQNYVKCKCIKFSVLSAYIDHFQTIFTCNSIYIINAFSNKQFSITGGNCCERGLRNVSVINGGDQLRQKIHSCRSGYILNIWPGSYIRFRSEHLIWLVYPVLVWKPWPDSYICSGLKPGSGSYIRFRSEHPDPASVLDLV